MIKQLSLLVFIVLLNACDEDDHVHTEREYPPALLSFDVVDSYGTNSEFDLDPLYLNPYRFDGEFELFWSVDANGPYRVEFILNTSPEVEGGALLSSAWCGRGYSCDNHSYQYCYYKPTLSIHCERPQSSQLNPRADVAGIVRTLPGAYFIVAEVCDQDLLYCETASRRIVME